MGCLLSSWGVVRLTILAPPRSADRLRAYSSPGFPGEGDRAQRGGGDLSLGKGPSTMLRMSPSPANAGEDREDSMRIAFLVAAAALALAAPVAAAPADDFRALLDEHYAW